MVKVGRKRLFKTRDDFRVWLEDNHEIKDELWLIFYKKHVKKKAIQYDEAVEEAICFGWIDGILKRIDDEKHVIRFTKRRPNSIWSQSNMARVKKLKKEGKMMKAGLDVYNSRDKSRQSPDLKKDPEIPDFVLKELKKHKTAFNFFNSLPPSHKNQYIWWINEAKREETKLRRLKKAIEMLEAKKKPGMQ